MAATLVKFDDVVILIFDGSDYKQWKRRLFKFVQLKKCKKVVIQKKNNNDKTEDWVKNSTN